MKLSDTNLLEAALKYSELGWHIIPCRPGVKIPLTPHGIKDATNDVEVIKAWWARWPTANIAVACGDKSGIHVVDVDKDDTKGVDGWETLKSEEPLPNTITQDTPRGGAHFIYRADDPPRNRNSFKPGIDIRSDGYYIMLPPSLHPNGKRYEWRKGHSPWDVEPAEFPDHMRPPEKNALPWGKPVPVKPPITPSGDKIIDRARLYLQECEPAIQGQAGHDKLLWAATALVKGFEIDDGTAINMLWNEYNPRCVPPWDRGNPSDAKDFERKVREAHKSSNPRGWLLVDYGLREDTALLETGRQIAESLLKKKPEPVAEVVEVVEEPGPETDDYPDWLLHPPGLVGKIVEYINLTAGCYQPLLAVGASLTACGALMGRKVRDQSNGRTNLYMMGVAHSSAGKDHPGDCIEQIISAAGVSHILGGSRVTSDTAIEVALEQNPVQLFQWDEIGHMFANIKAAGGSSSSATHLRTIVPALMELYSSPHKLWIGKQRAEEAARRIDQPHICVWGLTSPDVMYSGLSTAELRDGWLGRVITLISHSRPMYEIKSMLAPPKDVIESVRGWAERTVPAPEGTGGITAVTSAFQITVPTHGLAMQVFNDFGASCHRKMIACSNDGDMTQYLWGKALQNARRIALIIAAGEDFSDPVINEYHAKYACEFVRVNIERFRDSIQTHMADSVWEADKKRILDVVGLAKYAGMGKTEITRRTQSMRDKRTRDGYIQDLVEAGLLMVGRHPDHGAQTWFWKYPYGAQYMEAQ